MEENNRPLEPLETPEAPAAPDRAAEDLLQALAREVSRQMREERGEARAEARARVEITPRDLAEARAELAREKAEALAREKAERAAERKKARGRRRRALRDLLLRVVILAVVVYVLFFHLVGVTIMPSGDMYPRIDAGDLILYYRLDDDIRAQDVVVLRKPVSALELPGEAAAAPASASEDVLPGWRGTAQTYWRRALRWLGFPDPNAEETRVFVCRVVAAAGDSVEISEGERLVVNGNTMIESNIFYSTTEYTGFLEYPVTLGEGEYFVLADLRSGGADSRFFGPVSEEEILGTVITIVRRNNL